MKISIAKMYHGGGRRWLTLHAACNAEAKALLKKHSQIKHGYYDSNEHWNQRIVDRVARMLKNKHRRETP